MQGTFPASINAEILAGSRTDINIEAEFTGPAFTDQFGIVNPQDKPYVFNFSKFFQPVSFNVRWYSYDFNMHDPVKTGETIPPNVRMRPVKTEQVQSLDYAWWGGIKTDEGIFKQFVTLAEGEAEFEKGIYELGVTWDDAVRIFVDGVKVIDEWNPSKYTFDESPHKTIRLELNGKHFISVEHVELGGFATLSLKIRKTD